MNAPFPSFFARARALALLCLTGCLATPASGSAHQRAATPTPDADTSPAYHVLGHAQRRQQILTEDRAWTLGEDGYILAWTRGKDGQWSVGAVRQIARARAIAHNGNTLLAWTPDAILPLDPTLKAQGSLGRDDAIACTDGRAWQHTREGHLCVGDGSGQGICTEDTIPRPNLREGVCTSDGTTHCLSISDASGAEAWCTTPDALAFEGGSDAGYAVFHPTEKGGAWRVFRQGQWRDADADAQGEALRSGREDLQPCFADGGAARCEEVSRHDAPDSARVSARTLRNILIAKHGFYFIFRDGWYAVSTEDAPAIEDIAQVRMLADASQRVWLDENIMRAQVEDGVARVSSCKREENGGATIIDRDLSTGRATVVHRSDAGCPKRAEYHEGVLHLSYADRLLQWDILAQELREAPVEMSIKNALSSSLIAEPTLSRHCSHFRWDVSFRTAFSGKIPIARDICARHAVTLPWRTASHEGEGAALLLTGDFGSYLWLVHADSMRTHAVQTSEVIPAHATIYRQADGNYILSDRRTGRSMYLDPNGEVLDEVPMVMIGGRMWRETKSGVLKSDDGHQLLVTDAGVVLDGVGIGPITTRTLTHDMRRISAQPALFAQQLRLLGHSPLKDARH